MCWDRFLSRWRRRVASRSGRRWRCSRCRTAERDGRTFAVLPAKVFCSTLPSLVVVFFRFHFRVPCFCVFLVEPIAEFLSLSTNSSLFVLFFANPAHRRPPFLPSRRTGEQRVTGFFFVVFFTGSAYTWSTKLLAGRIIRYCRLIERAIKRRRETDGVATTAQ